MSTRATYRFEAGDVSRRTSGMSHPPVTFYIHHDGYPQGAAVYFWNMHHDKSHDSSHAGRFYRSNERAEFTDGHEAHGDTEYRYTLRGSFLTGYKRYHGTDVSNWQVFYTGEWDAFVNQYGPGAFDEFTPLRLVAPLHSYRGAEGRIYSRGQILAGLIKAREELASYRERFPDAEGNIRWHQSTITEWERVLTDYNAQEAFDNAKPAQG